MPMAEPFAVGACYTNAEIAEALGTAHLNYIRFVAGKRVVALCLNAWEHPRAPAEVWVGGGGAWDRIRNSAQWLINQCAAAPGVAVPLFLKDVATQGGDRSRCHYGRYRVVEDTEGDGALA